MVLAYSRTVDPNLPLVGLESAPSDEEGLVTVKLCAQALGAFFRQSHDKSTNFLDKLGQCRISKVVVEFNILGAHDWNQDRFVKLCETIQGQSTLQAATMDLSQSWTHVHAVLLHHLPHITSLDIVDIFDGNISPDLIGSLTRHPRLETIGICKWTTPLHKQNNPTPGTPERSRRNMQILIDLLGMVLGMDRDWTVNTCDFDFAQIQASPSLSDAVATARVKRPEIQNCNVGAAIPFAEALAKSQVSEVFGSRRCTLMMTASHCHGRTITWRNGCQGCGV